MVLCRLLQGIGCGAIVSAGLTSFFDIYPPEKSSRLVSVLNGTIGALMAIAPLVGNWITIHVGWRTNFYIIAGLAGVAFFSTLFLIKETHPIEKRRPLQLNSVIKNYFAVLANGAFMAHTLIWCLSFSIMIVFIANLSLLLIDHMKVPQEIFGYYQTTVMGAYFIGSLIAAAIIKKCGMLTTKIAGIFIYLVGVFALGALTFFNNQSPGALVFSMACASFGGALCLVIFFSYSMTFLDDHLKGCAMSLTQSLRLLLSSCLVGVTATFFDGTIKPVAYITLLSTAVCIGLYVYLYMQDKHIALTTVDQPVH